MKRMQTVGLLAVAMLGLASFATTAGAQAPRKDVIWARSTAGAHITLDGVLSEPAWAKAESTTIKYRVNNGDPGSGWKDEAGIVSKDPMTATVKFLLDGNQLYMAVTVRDSSIGGSADFNREDGLLMSVKDHRDSLATIHGPTEYFYSWWHPEDPNPTAVGKKPGFRGYWSSQSDTIARTVQDSLAWDAVTKVKGTTNTDAGPDTSYTVEMRFDVSMMGYTPTATNGDIVEWNGSIYDCDWLWPFQNKFSANRSWWESPWGNAMWYDQVQIHCRPDVTINSGAVPTVDPDVVIPNAGGYAAPTIDGLLTEPVWQTMQHFDMRYDDFALRNTYPGVMKWRAGQYQPAVNGGTAPVVDPGDATIHWFFKADTLYIGFDVRDQVVQWHPLEDRWDGFRVIIDDTTHSGNEDHVRDMRQLGFHVGPTGSPIADGYLPFLRDTLHAARLGLKLKPNTTVDTTGATPDEGYTAELAVDLHRAFGFPTGLANTPLWIGIDMLDGDSFIPITDSYGTRTWWGVEVMGQCCPANAYLNPNAFVTAVEDPRPGGRAAVLLGNRPNPFRQSTLLQYSLPQTSHVILDVFDLQGRTIEHRSLGVQTAGRQQAAFTRQGLGAGLYLYRLTLRNPTSEAQIARLSGKMMVVK